MRPSCRAQPSGRRVFRAGSGAQRLHAIGWLRCAISRTPGICIVCLVAVLPGCVSVGPDYRRPELPLADAWNQAVIQDLDPAAPRLVDWWDVLGDPVLTDLIRQAAEANRDVRAVMARVEQAQATYGVARSAYVPTVQGIGSAAAVRSSEETVPVLPEGIDRETTQYQIGVDFAWELDLWGRVRRSVEAARASYEAAEEAYRDALVVLSAQVALTYIDIRTLQQRISDLQANLGMLEESLEIVRQRNAAGLAPDLNVAQAERDLAVNEAALPPLRGQLVALLNRLGVLVGRPPSALHELLAEIKPVPPVPDRIEVGIPAEILRQRPDIRQRERELAAQTARIGVAKAEYFPIFALPGTLVLEAFDAGNILDPGSRTYSFGPAFRWNLFAGGRVRQFVRLEEARTTELLNRYEQQVLLAVEEVETAMSDMAQERERHRKLREAVAAARRTQEMSDVLYRSGLTDFQNVLDAQRILIAQQADLAVSSGRLCADVVRLFKSLGGGWQSPAGVKGGETSEVKP